MLIYAVNEQTKSAVTIGMTPWFKDENMVLLEQLDTARDKIIGICGPSCLDKKKIFNSYLDDLSKNGTIRVMLDFQVPDDVVKKKGFWEYQVYVPFEKLSRAVKLKRVRK